MLVRKFPVDQVSTHFRIGLTVEQDALIGSISGDPTYNCDVSENRHFFERGGDFYATTD
jgi:hypothetical protein